MFDKAEIRVKSGSGGDGAIHFQREKFVPFGGPDGGDGGTGGNIVLRADHNVDSLRGYRRNKLYRAGSGLNGGGRQKHGRRGEDVVLKVPPGTIVRAVEASGDIALIADLNMPGDEVIVARGGRGGWGNAHYATSTNQAPQIAQRGEEGREVSVSLEMRLIADAGIIGYPNAGKSTLLAAASAARPKVADYPFTTIEPVLGQVEVGRETFVLAEIPGLIEGAHRGKGLGHEFLRHAMRTRVLVHLLDGTSESPVDDMLRINEEILLYDPALATRSQIIALNKIDLPEVSRRREALQKELSGAGIKAYYISAATGQGVDGLMKEIMKLLKKTGVEPSSVPEKVKIFRPPPRDTLVKVVKEGDEYVISAPGLDRIMVGAGVTPGELRWQLKQQLGRVGANKVLEKAGVKPGDKVRLGETTWEW